MPKAKKTKKSQKLKTQPPRRSSVVEDAWRAKGFNSFDDYVCSRSGLTLVDMAEDLGVKAPTFIAYHTDWMQAMAASGEIEPLYLDTLED